MNFNSKNLFFLTLITVSGLMFGLFVYLFKIENSVKDYNDYKNSLTELRFLDKEFNNFFLKKNRFTNFDLIVGYTNKFEKILEELKQSNFEKDFGFVFKLRIDEIEELFFKKLELIEDYKSRQSSTLNSMHFIYDLNRDLQDDLSFPLEYKSYLNKTIFMLIQGFIGIEYDIQKVLLNLEYIKDLKTKNLDERVKFLSKHIEQIIIKKNESVNIFNKAKSIPLENSLKKTSFLLDKIYDKNLFNQLIIALLFFLFAFIIMIILVKIYFNTLKIKKELSAFKYAVQHSDNSIVLTDAKRKIVYVNENFELNTGYKIDELEGNKPKILSSGLTPSENYDELNKKLNSGQKWEGEFINKRKDGSIFYEKASIVPIFINDELVNYLAIKLDITKYIKQQEELKESSIVFDNTEEGIVITDKNANILSANDSYEKMSGFKKSELIGKKSNIFKSSKHDKIFYKSMWHELKEKGLWKGKVYDTSKSGSSIPIWLNVTAVRDEKGKIIKYICIHTNLQEIIDTQEKAEFLAYHDSLTSLPNRVRLEEHLNHVIDVSLRNNLTMSILFIDLDRFKIINDTLGHQVGDKLLQIVAKRIKSILRQSDMLARMGGDEFVVVLETARNKNSAAFVCKKILEVLKETIKIANHDLNTTASIGVAMYPEDGDNISQLIKHADAAMYHAKKKGKNTFEYYDKQLSIDVHDQLKIEQALKLCISNHELYLNYQPQFNIKTNEVKSFEALVRWNSFDLGFVSPATFIPIAEDTGMIIEVGNFVFEQACKDFIKFKEIDENLEYIAINISSIQFRDEKFISNIKQIIKNVNIRPDEIELEITERYIMDFNESNMMILNELRDLGFRMSIDDFGTGYSSMSYLNKLPIDIIKVDKAFIDDIPEDNNNLQIAKGIIALAKSLGYKTVAEGIEYQEQQDALIELGCDLGQGYLISKPLSYDGIVEFLNK